MMKKGRPAQKLSVLCEQEQCARLVRLVMTESTSIGVRHVRVSREKCHRRCVEVSTPYGEVTVKIAAFEGVVTNVAPEYESARSLARESKTPLKLVLHAATAAGWACFPEGGRLSEQTI